MRRLLPVVVALLIGLAFHARNHQTVMIDLYTVRAELPLSWVVVAALVLGAGLGSCAMLPHLLRVRRALWRARRLASKGMVPGGSSPSL